MTEQPSTWHTELGALKSEHARNQQRHTRFVLLLLVAGLVGILGGVMMRSRQVGGAICVSGFGGIVLILGGVAIYTAIRERDLRVVVYDQGFVQTRAGSELVVSWDQVATVNHTVMRRRRPGVTPSTTHLCTLDVKAQGPNRATRLQFSGATLQDVEELCKAIQDGTLEPMVQEARTKLQTGEEVPFGKLTATREGLRLGKTTAPWRKVGQLRTDDGWVILQVDGECRRVAPTAQVNNTHVLRVLVERGGVP